MEQYNREKTKSSPAKQKAAKCDWNCADGPRHVGLFDARHPAITVEGRGRLAINMKKDDITLSCA